VIHSIRAVHTHSHTGHTGCLLRNLAGSSLQLRGKQCESVANIDLESGQAEGYTVPSNYSSTRPDLQNKSLH